MTELNQTYSITLTFSNLRDLLSLLNHANKLDKRKQGNHFLGTVEVSLGDDLLQLLSNEEQARYFLAASLYDLQSQGWELSRSRYTPPEKAVEAALDGLLGPLPNVGELF